MSAFGFYNLPENDYSANKDYTYLCLVNFSSAKDCPPIEWYSRILDALEAGRYKIWTEPGPEHEPLPDHGGLFHIELSNTVPEDKHDKAVVLTVKDLVLHYQEEAIFEKAKDPETEKLFHEPDESTPGSFYNFGRSFPEGLVVFDLVSWFPGVLEYLMGVCKE